MELPAHTHPVVTVPSTPIKLHPISPLYRLGLFAVAIGLMLLPVLYFGLVGVIVWTVYLHIQNLDWYMDHLRGLFGATVFIAPILTGGVLVFFMSRPFFARQEKQPESLAIDPAAEPVLFEFIRAICRLLGAPVPKRVYVDWQVNASASLHRGWRSFFNRDLDLTLGLPLVAALTVSQLAGVLAHEFGHFAQGAGMRFNYLIRKMNLWLARVAYQPGDLEDKLARSGFNRNIWGNIALGTARFGIWMARQILHGLTMLGHAISCFSLRQMEFDADLYEAKVSGPAEFTNVMKRLRFLNTGWNAADYLVLRNWEDNRLARDLSALTLAQTEAVFEYQKRELDEEAANERSGWFRTHPSERERIEHVSRCPIYPVFTDSCPASELFRNFTALSEQVTLWYYVMLGLPLEGAKLCDVEEICDGRALGPSKLRAVRAFFANRLSVRRPVIFGPGDLAEPLSSNSGEACLRENRREWETALADSQEVFEKFEMARARAVASEQARWLKDASVRFRPQNFFLVDRSREKITQSRTAALAELSEVEPALLPFEAVARRRLVDALRLALAANVVANPPINELADTLARFRPIAELEQRLRDDFAIYAVLYPQPKAQSPRHRAHQLRQELSQTLNHQLSALNPLLNNLVLPYDDRSSLLTRLRRRLPDDPLAFETTIYRDVSVYLEEIDAAYVRLMGDLCVAAQKAEATITL
jgi:Zn-dependent protease with chaperone function